MNGIKFEVFSSGDLGERKMIAMYADLPDTKLRYISFFFTKKEFEQFTIGAWETFDDIAHKCYTVGDTAVFYNFEIPKSSHGELKVPYYTMNFPLFARKVILRMAERIWRNNSEERVKIHIDSDKLNKWNKLYGQGTGNVDVEMDYDTKNFFEGFLSDPGFNRKIEQLTDIAKNGTRAYFQKGKVILRKDWDGFTFNILHPNGDSTMFGGLVNHGKDGENDWSIHT